MREKALALLRAAPRGDRNVTNAEPLGLLGEDAAQIEMRRFGPPEAIGDFRTYFITLAANTYATMHYDVTCPGEATRLQEVDGPLQNPAGRAAPPRVDERERAFVGHRQVHGYAVRDGDREQDAGFVRRMSIDPVEDEPTLRERLVPLHRGPVDLMGEDDGGKAIAECRAERAPPADDLTDRLFTP